MTASINPINYEEPPEKLGHRDDKPWSHRADYVAAARRHYDTAFIHGVDEADIGARLVALTQAAALISIAESLEHIARKLGS